MIFASISTGYGDTFDVTRPMCEIFSTERCVMEILQDLD